MPQRISHSGSYDRSVYMGVKPTPDVLKENLFLLLN